MVVFAVIHVFAPNLTLELRIRNSVVIQMYFAAKMFWSRLNFEMIAWRVVLYCTASNYSCVKEEQGQRQSWDIWAVSVVTSNSRTSDQHGQSCMPCLSERYKSERRAFLVSKVTQNLQQCLQVHAVECFLAVPEVDIDLLRLKQPACSGALNPRPFSSSQEGSC